MIPVKRWHVYTPYSSDFNHNRQGFLLFEVVLGMLLLLAISLMTMTYFSSLAVSYQRALRRMHGGYYTRRALEQGIIELQRTKRPVNKSYQEGPYTVLVAMHPDAITPGFVHVQASLRGTQEHKCTLYTGVCV